jgi:hypothetical protein
MEAVKLTDWRLLLTYGLSGLGLVSFLLNSRVVDEKLKIKFKLEQELSQQLQEVHLSRWRPSLPIVDLVVEKLNTVKSTLSDMGTDLIESYIKTCKVESVFNLGVVKVVRVTKGNVNLKNILTWNLTDLASTLAKYLKFPDLTLPTTMYWIFIFGSPYWWPFK